MSTRTVLFLAAVASTLLAANARGADFQCLLTKCGTEAMACTLDKNCFLGFTCLHSCEGDMECVYKCWATFYSEALNNLVDCTINEHKCIRPPNPHPVKCRKPTNLAVDFKAKMLTGSFYNVYGLNPLYECRDFSHKFVELKGNDTLMMTEWYDLTMFDGASKTFTDEAKLTSSTNSPSVLALTSIGKGLRRSDEYRVLGHSDNWFFVYYCGETCGTSYEGAIVLSRTPSLSPEDTKAVEKEVAKYGWDLSQFCMPKQKAFMVPNL